MSTEFKELIAVIPLKELLRQLINNNCQFVNDNKKKQLSMLNEKSCLANKQKSRMIRKKKNTI